MREGGREERRRKKEGEKKEEKKEGKLFDPSVPQSSRETELLSTRCTVNG